MAGDTVYFHPQDNVPLVKAPPSFFPISVVGEVFPPKEIGFAKMEDIAFVLVFDTLLVGNVILQGSMDGVVWEDVKQIVPGDLINKAITYRVVNWFHYFRLNATGATAGTVKEATIRGVRRPRI
jgi:hypothetical protein